MKPEAKKRMNETFNERYISISHSNQKLSQYFQYITVQRTHTCKLKNT